MPKNKFQLKPATEAQFAQGLEGTKVTDADYSPSAGMDELILKFSNGHKLRIIRGNNNPNLFVNLWVPITGVADDPTPN